MKKLTLLILMVWGAIGAYAQETVTPLFAYPAIPDSISSIQARYDYYVSHFWDRANPKGIFSSKPRMAAAFADYLSPLRFASVDTVRNSVARFMKSIEKQPSDVLFVAELAERNLYGDSAEIWSDELMLEFLRPVLANKRVPKASKERLALIARQLENTLAGKPFKTVEYTAPDGAGMKWQPRPGVAAFIFFNDPECSDCNLARIRLKADVRANELVGANLLDIVALSPVEPDDAWKAQAVSYPKEWIVGANPDFDLEFDLRAGTPDFYVVDEQGNLLMKHATIEQILEILRKI